MRSIRLSLLVYFLGLLGLALGAVSLLVYRTTQQRLAEHKAKAEQLIQTRNQDRIATEKSRLDEWLNNDAHVLAREAQGQIEARAASQMTLTGFWFEERHRNPEWQWMDDRPDRRRPPLRGRSLAGLDALLTALNPMGSHVLNPFWTAEAGGGAFAPAWHDDYRPEILMPQVDGGELPLRLQVATYYQIDCSWERTYRSEALADSPFPFDARSFGADPVYEIKFDEIELRPGLTVRRVTLKAPFGRPFAWPPRRAGFGSRPPN